MHRQRTHTSALLGILILVVAAAVTAPAGSASAAALPGGLFQPMNAERLLDTGNGTGAPARAVASHATVTFQVTGHTGVPTSGVGAAVLNITVASPASSGYLTAYPAGQARPVTSTLNFVKGQTVPNLAVVRLGVGGQVSLYNGSSGTVRLVADISGYYTAGAATLSGAMTALSPARLLDTGSGLGAPRHTVASHATLTFQVSGRGGVPLTGVSSVVLNVTAATPATGGYLTTYPYGAARPVASSLNFTAGQSRANAVIVRLGTAGKVSVYNGSAGPVRLVADVSGYFRSGSATQSGALVSLPPTRVLDTGLGLGAPKGSVGPDEDLTFQLTSHGGVPASGASAVVLNVTVASPTRGGYLTVYPSTARSRTSNLNFSAAHNVANLVMVRVRTDGKVTLHNSSTGTVRLVADVAGYSRATPSALSWSAGSAPTSTAGVLRSVSCASATFCAAVNDSGQVATFDGGAWSAPTNVASGLALQSISCPTATFCMAVGATSAVTFNGASWSSPTTVDSSGGLTVVSCPSTTFCMAVSSVGFGASGHAVRYSSGTWSSPVAASHGLSGLSCSSSSFCMATDDHANFYLYDGSSWADPDYGVPYNGVHLSCVSSTFCAAVGSGKALTYDGSTWSAPQTIDTTYSVDEVSCTSPSHCVLSTGDIAASTYDGVTWSTPTSVMARGTSFGASISCAGTTFCELVANDGYGSTFNGATWSSTTSIAPTTGVGLGLSCASTTQCVEVTNTGAAMVFNGTTWSAPVELLSRSELFAVDCPTTSWCLAVSSQEGAAVTFDGTTAGPTTNDGLPSIGVVEVSCASPTFCVAAAGGQSATFNGTAWTAPVSVGMSFVASLSCPQDDVCVATSGHDSARFDGASWTTVAMSSDESFGPVECASSTWCIIAGRPDALQISDYPPAGIDSATYDGTSWSGVTMIDPGGWGVSSISCPSASFCAGVGTDGTAVTYDGSRWSQPVSLEVEESGSELWVSCPTVTQCFALSLATGRLYVGTA